MRRDRSADRVGLVLALIVAAVLLAGVSSVHPGPVDAVHDVLQDWARDFLDGR